MRGGLLGIVLGLAAFHGALVPVAKAEDSALKSEIDALKKELESIRKDRVADRAALDKASSSAKPVGGSSVDKAVAAKYGPNNPVTTKSGKLVIGGLVQIWYYSIANDNKGFFAGDDNVDINATKDNDSFRIRRAELNFTFDVHENIQARIMIDPAREAQSFPNFPSNLGNPYRGRTSLTSGAVTNVQDGTGAAPRFLQDAFIRYHGVIPHHEFQIGQYKPWVGYEALVSSASLDFAERSFIGQLGDFRDSGANIFGSWWDDRFQYWFGVAQGAGNLHQSGGQQQNRSDDNDEKDFTARLLVRPVWKNKTWGSLELGVGAQYGIHGEAGDPQPDGADADTNFDGAINGLNRRKTNAYRATAWLNYELGGPVSGWWIRGEYLRTKDRNIPGAVRGFPQSSTPNVQDSPNPFITEGFYVSTGYKIANSIFKDKAPGWLMPFEFAARYEHYQNITVGDLSNPETHTDVFATDVITAGINYYIKGNNAKIQLNYNWVNEPDNNSNPDRSFREVRNDSLVVNFQVGF